MSESADAPAPALPRILVLCGFRIFPAQTGGHLRTGSIARALARLGYPVHMYALAGRQEDYRPGKPPYRVDEIESRLTEETHLGWTIGMIQTVMRRLGHPRRWQYELLRRGWIPARLRKALQEADLVLCDLPYCPPVPGPWRDKPCYLISHNLEHVLLEQGNAAERRHAAWMAQIERRAPQTYRDIIACAQSDLSFFRQHDTSASRHLPLVGCGVDARAYRPAAGVRERTRAELGVADDERLVVFSGSHFGPNLDALGPLKAFARERVEWLTQHRLRLLLAGSMEPQPWREGAVIATGRVPEMLPFFAAADAGLNPVTRGSGSNVKLFEYLAARLPVISTAFGVRGSSLQAGPDYVEFDPANPVAAFEQLLAFDRAQWTQRTEQTWVRHRSECDIDEMVRAAILQLPDFRLAREPGR